jgi:hypothetical protein
MTIIISGLDIQPANYGVSGELPSRSTWEPISSVTTDLTGASIMSSTNSNSSQTGNTTMNTPSNDTILNSNIINESSSLNSNITKESSSLNSNITNKSSINTTMPEQLPPESINGSKVPKI